VPHGQPVQWDIRPVEVGMEVQWKEEEEDVVVVGRHKAAKRHGELGPDARSSGGPELLQCGRGL
jgi:hypothetical protein